MHIRRQFSEALAAESEADDGEDNDLLPVHLTRAAVTVLGANGASLSMHPARGRRTPLGASDEEAETAERLQFTAGVGPCFSTARSGLPSFADESVLRNRWPAYLDLLRTHTSFRSVVAHPLPGRLRGMGALDLYMADPNGVGQIDAVESHEVAGLIAEQLAHAADWSAWTEIDKVSGPGWMDTSCARRRTRVWQATGMVSLALEVPTPDALDVLRSYAYARDRDLDVLVAAIISGELPAAHLRNEAQGNS